MTRAARTYDVVFFEAPAPGDVTTPCLELRPVAEGVTVAVPTFPLKSSTDPGTGVQDRVLRQLLCDLLDDLPAARRIFWYCTPLALAFSRDVASNATIYDNMDSLATRHHAPTELLQIEQALLARCDLVFCGGQSLYEAKRHRHPNVHAFPSSVDRAHFGRARSALPQPADIAAFAHPRLGYFGVIDDRIDLDLVDHVTSESPDWQWIMLGPVAKIDPAALPRRPNLHWLGARSHEDLPAYLAHCDLGVMPLALNDATRFSNPTTTAEFLAAGVPVVSTPIHDVVRPYGEQGLVEIAAGWEQFLSDARLLLRRPREAWLEDVDLYLATHSWERTWGNMDVLIRNVLDRADMEADVVLPHESALEYVATSCGD